MITIVVVGGAGLVGGAVANYLNQCLGVVLKSYRRSEVDLLKPETWNGKFKDADVVLIAAGLSNGTLSQLEAVNAHGVHALSKYCSQLGVRKLILISSGAVYGHTGRFTSPDDSLNPMTDYAKSKLMGERLAKKEFDARINILRLYFPYGPGEGIDRLIPRLKQKIIEGKPLICRSDGGPFLSLMHVDDMAQVIVNDFILNDTNTCEVNLASDQILSIRELGFKISVGLGRKVYFEENSEAVDVKSLPYQFAWRPFIFY